MITEDRVTFEIAKLLRDKGFPQNTFEIDCNVCYKYNGNLCNNAKSMSGVDREISYMAPTIQMVLKWLREVYDIYIVSRKDFFNGTYTGMIYDGRRENVFDKEDYIANVGNKTYEESCEETIKYVLEHI